MPEKVRAFEGLIPVVHKEISGRQDQAALLLLLDDDPFEDDPFEDEPPEEDPPEDEPPEEPFDDDPPEDEDPESDEDEEAADSLLAGTVEVPEERLSVR
ncbi:hypothetical protein EV644_11637 [Kribbella orskensis]|uniref:Uncharacterized protein n=1 Tax=Kribbella orskensis TaxID=2512216 RepID=A0ABY2BF74_9ACTN|nr:MULTISPECIES: hypothetical protein [Kribbella]TCN35245.1 hypothetical protein EV642_11737 [Kribbella sp. VKM Ac-2500]TCO16667.1 hypothetical protein EV644_11637 [Kribbella orskensis]